MPVPIVCVYVCLWLFHSPMEAWTSRVRGTDPRISLAFRSRRPCRRMVLLRSDAALPIPDASQPHHVAPFLPYNVKAQLDAAVGAFCARHVRVDVVTGKVLVPCVFEECRDIFGSSNASILAWLAAYMPVLGSRPRDAWALTVEVARVYAS
jgi:hypothetical protein